MSYRHIGSLEWSFASPGRIGVFALEGYWKWCVCDDRGRVLPKGDWLARFDTHEEAIAYAQSHATEDVAKYRLGVDPS